MTEQFPDHRKALAKGQGAGRKAVANLMCSSLGGVFGALSGSQALADAPGDPRRGGLDGIPGKVGISGRRLNLGVTEQLADHREALAQGQRPRSKAVSEVVDPHIVEPGRLAYPPPGLL